MEKTRKVLIAILYSIAILVAICSILSIFRNTESRYLKMLDFPRIQFFLLSIVSLIILILLAKHRHWYNYTMISALILGLIINGSYLINYTPLVPVSVPSLEVLDSDKHSISILVINVKMTNRNTKELFSQIKVNEPDIILAMEIDTWWNEKLHHLDRTYPYFKKSINDVTYGMVLYSKYPFQQIEIDYINNDKVPFIESIIELSDDKRFKLHCVHPVPLTHFKDLPDNEGQDEVAMKKLGAKVESVDIPTIVMGDFNDVVWSDVDGLTDTKNLLFDVRTGRGFYNSYNAENFLMRWPLDHIYVTKEFHLKELERLDDIGSDHFPIYAELVL